MVIVGPHGPMKVPPPAGLAPGSEAAIRLGPPGMNVVIPEGLRQGEPLQFQDPGGAMRQIIVPFGKKAGDTLEILPAAVMVQVPKDARPGDTLLFNTVDTYKQLTAEVPGGLSEGDYFAVML